VILIAAGDASSAEQLRAGLAMGADRAILLKCEPGMDGLATAKALAGEIGDLGADLIMTGMKATDDDQQQVGAMLATLLGLPCITVVASMEVADGRVKAHREIEGGVEHVEAPLPAVVTIAKQDFEPRLASLKGIMAAKRKPFEEKEVELAQSRIQLIGLSHPPERPEGRIVGNGADAVPELVRLLKEEARVI
jgi:electron transfer flavoprotein beta subunit